jgi:hypothetical protein
METSEPRAGCHLRGTLRVGYKARLLQNKVLATNVLAVLVLSYSFVYELKHLDRETRKLMTLNWSLHPKFSIQRVYVSPERRRRKLRESTRSRRADSLTRLVPPDEWEGVGAFLFRAARRATESHGLQHPIPGRQDLLGQHMSKAMNSVLFKHVREHSLSIDLTYAFLKSADRRVRHGMSSNQYQTPCLRSKNHPERSKKVKIPRSDVRGPSVSSRCEVRLSVLTLRVLGLSS